MKPRSLILSAALAIGLIALGAPIVHSMNPSLSATVYQTAPIPEAQIPQNIQAAVNAPDRSAEDKALDPGRKPDQTLAFFGIKPGMKVADLFAGGGYTTELLSRAVGPTGTVYSQNGPFPEKYKKIADTWHARLQKPVLKNVVEVDKPFSAPDLLPVAPGSLDAALINLNYHDLVGFKADMAKVNAAVLIALKPGGVYGIVDHSAQAGSGDRDTTTLHRIDENFVIGQVEKGGFKLAASSSALRHPEDDRTWFVFAHRGETDRFVLKFVKPE
ncbi:MAG: class I SAM-dependent methyltransferase [Candidatus Binataceae bacterium]